MNGAVLTTVMGLAFLAAGTTLVALDRGLAGAVLLVVAVLALFIVIGMAVSDAKERAGGNSG